jgi:hypothetical protein
MVTIIKSLTVLIIISSFIAGCCNLLGAPFWPAFGLAVISQILIFNLFRIWFEARSTIIIENIKNKRIEEYSKQGLNCICPDENCAHVSFVPIQLNTDNIYTCLKCNKQSRVYIGNKTFLLTEPYVDNPFKNFNFVEQRDYNT